MVVPTAAGEKLQDRLGHRFYDQGLLAQALSHRSWCAEHVGEPSNERLEFLGDAVLGLVVTDYIFQKFPDLAEGNLAKLRASVVNAEILAELATEVGVGPALLLGRGEDASGGREKPSILADALEALIGAVYLDGGRLSAEQLVLSLLQGRIHEFARGPGGQDYKTRFQELAASKGAGLPVYQIRTEGPDHAKRFFATVMVGSAPVGEGKGRSKKQAEQAAARAAWVVLAGEVGDGSGTEEAEPA